MAGGWSFRISLDLFIDRQLASFESLSKELLRIIEVKGIVWICVFLLLTEEASFIFSSNKTTCTFCITQVFTGWH